MLRATVREEALVVGDDLYVEPSFEVDHIYFPMDLSLCHKPKQGKAAMVFLEGEQNYLGVQWGGYKDVPGVHVDIINHPQTEAL